MKNRDSILLHSFALIALATVTMSTPLGAQTVGDRIRVFSAGIVTFGRVTGVNNEGFEVANDDLHRSFAYRDLDRLEVVGGIRTWGHEGVAFGSVWGTLLAFDEDLNVFEGSLIGGLLGLVFGVAYPFFRPEEARPSWRPISVREYFVPVLGEEFPYGGRVRVSVNGSELIGRATAMTDEGFELVQVGMRRSFTYRDIDGLEWSRGMRSRWKTGWGLGLLGGFIAFPTFNGAWGCVASDWEGPSCEEKGRDLFAWIGAGGLLGLGVGSVAWRHESWESFALRDRRPGISPFVAPLLGLERRHGLFLGARIGF
ncbi:MAG: hypothetical protein F4106_09080 [Gemmatimonadetes bacterium]|nr:hypothetical protein [Gemmatimonadota bacterium]MYJ18180.1 hypothetical protein [Gemmatimonadota bacterium]